MRKYTHEGIVDAPLKVVWKYLTDPHLQFEHDSITPLTTGPIRPGYKWRTTATDEDGDLLTREHEYSQLEPQSGYVLAHHLLIDPSGPPTATLMNEVTVRAVSPRTTLVRLPTWWESDSLRVRFALWRTVTFAKRSETPARAPTSWRS